MENEIIKIDNIYQAKEYCNDKKQCSINKTIRIKYLIEKYNLKNQAPFNIKFSYSNVTDICICGNKITNVNIIEIKDNLDNKFLFKLGNTCILEFDEGEDILKKYLRKTYDCNDCGIKRIKKEELINKNHNCYYFCNTCKKYTFRYTKLGHKYLLHKCFFKICSSCHLIRHHIKYSKCYNCSNKDYKLCPLCKKNKCQIKYSNCFSCFNI